MTKPDLPQNGIFYSCGKTSYMVSPQEPIDYTKAAKAPEQYLQAFSEQQIHQKKLTSAKKGVAEKTTKRSPS